MDVIGQLHASAALPQGILPQHYPEDGGTMVPIGKEAGWASEPVWTRWWREELRLLPGFKPRIIQPVAQR
jgi:hypothetical protein